MPHWIFTSYHKHIEAETKWQPFSRRHFQENAWILLKIPLKSVPKVRINNIPALVQIMAWRRPGDKPLSEPMMVSLLTHICVTRPQWVKKSYSLNIDSVESMQCYTTSYDMNYWGQWKYETLAYCVCITKAMKSWWTVCCVKQQCNK